MNCFMLLKIVFSTYCLWKNIFFINKIKIYIRSQLELYLRDIHRTDPIL